MKIALHSKIPAAAGYALMLTLMFLGITLLGFGSIMAWVSSSSLITDRNNLHVSAQAAAESATENVMTMMMRDFTYGTLNAVSGYQAMVPNTNGWPVVFTFQDTNGVANQTSVTVGPGTWKQLPSQFNGLYGYGQDCVIASAAATAGTRYKVGSTVSQAVWFGNIPLFQFAIFYNQDMELNPGSSMTINGRVHSNYNIWATGNSSSAPLTFSNSVDASGFSTNRSSTLDPRSPVRSGNTVYANTNYPVSNADSLTLPVGSDGNNNPTNVESILRLPPDSMMAPQPAAYSTNGQVYLYNESDLIISNSPSGINGNSSSNFLSVYYQNSANTVNPLTPVSPDVTAVQTVSSNAYVISLAVSTNLIPTTSYTTNITSYVTGSGHNRHTVYTTNITANAGTPITQVVTNSVTNVITSFVTVTNYYYSFVTNQTFYDYREGKTVQAVQVDVGKLNTWLTTGGQAYDNQNVADKGHGISSVYAYSGVGMDSSTLPAVRVTDGAQLPAAGLTVSTPLPLYVMGNYNITDGSGTSTALGDTVHTRPAALLGDALTVLSGNWSDTYNSGTLAGTRTVSSANTTINAATMEGIVPSDGTYYSGGVENFLRLLEQWSGHTLTYNGSIVVMFPSQYATTPWQKNGNYYSVPTRNWGFDTNFQDSSKLPPLTPQVKATVRGAYVTK